jgi:hypothetical protein
MGPTKIAPWFTATVTALLRSLVQRTAVPTVTVIDEGTKPKSVIETGTVVSA